MRIKQEIKKLWQTCFDDSDEFVEMYFRLRYNSETTMYFQSGNMIISSLQMPFYPMTFEGKEIQTAYISGACTLPEFRGKGVMERLLAECFSRMVQKNILLSTLIPANTGLYGYYAKFGYAPAFFRSKTVKNVSEFTVPKGNLHIEHYTTFDQRFYDYFSGKASLRTNYVQHTLADFEAAIEDMRISGGGVTVAYKGKNGSIGGILFAYPEGNSLKVAEWFADNDGIRDNLFREAARHHHLTTIIRYELPKHAHHEEEFGMARIINAKLMLKIYAAAYPNEKLHIHLTDEQLAFNNGYYSLQNGISTFSLNPLENQHIEMNANELNAFIFNQARLYMSLMLE